MKGYHYYAFISYKSEDEEWAEWLQDELQEYSFPEAVRLVRPDLPEQIRPVFRDKVDLTSGSLSEAIRNALDDSGYLIVLCTPLSAGSPWVAKEVQHFIDSQRTGQIIPFIINGEPYSKILEDRCYPEPLYALKGKPEEPRGISVNEMGRREAAAVKAIANMFGLDFRLLWDCYREAEERRNREWLASQSRSFAEKAKMLARAGSLSLARRLSAFILPRDLDLPDRPYTSEAEMALRMAMSDNSVTLHGHRNPVKQVVFSADGASLASLSTDSRVFVWDTATGLPLLKGKEVFGGCERLELMYADSVVCLRRRGPRKVLHFIPKKYSDLACMDRRSGDNHLPDGREVLNDSNSVWISSSPGVKTSLYEASGFGILSIDCSPDPFSQQIALACDDGAVRLICLDSAPIIINDGVALGCSAAAGTDLVASTYFGELRLWNITNGKLVAHCFDVDLGRKSCVSYSPDGQYLVVSDSNGNVSLFGSMGLEKIASFELCEPEKLLYRGPSHILAISRNADRVLMVSHRAASVWSIDHGLWGPRLMSLIDREDPVVFAALSLDGKYLAFSDKEDYCWIKDLESNKKQQLSVEGVVAGGAFGSDSMEMALVTVNGMVHRFHSVEEIGTIRLEDSGPSLVRATFHPDLKYVAGICGDGRIRVWNMSDGICVMEMTGYGGTANSIVFSIDGNKIITTSLKDRSIRIWDFPPLQELIDCIRKRFGDALLTEDEKVRLHCQS